MQALKILLPFLVFLNLLPVSGFGQHYFRSGIFLHHSTGSCIWGPNGSNTSVPQEMNLYNLAHGYTGAQAITMNEEWWAPGDNEWATQHTFFEDPSPVTGIGYYLPGNKIIVIKTCFPASAMTGVGQPSDTTNPYLKTIWNYKWHWRHIVRVMKDHPENFFVIWTNAPLEPGSTNASQAALSKRFCTWAKDTLAAGLDPAFGTFPANVSVFDFFSKLTGPNGMMMSQYAAGPGDSHPNAAATELVAPQFVNEIFDASILYEVIYGIPDVNRDLGHDIHCFPNPCRERAIISFNLNGARLMKISLHDPSGRYLFTVADWEFQPGLHAIELPVSGLSPGLYHMVWNKDAEKGIRSIVVY